MKEYICRSWTQTADGWTSEFDRFRTREEAEEHGKVFVSLKGLDETAREFEVIEEELTPDKEVNRLRRMTGLSQTAFGQRYGIPMRTIQNWENGVSVPPEYVINLLRRVVQEDF